MQIAILSDIHDHVRTLERALPRLREADAVLCCGDLCSPFVLAQLGAGLSAPLHLVFGNNDGDLYRLTDVAAGFDHVHLHGSFFRGEIAGVRVAMTHYPEIAAGLDPAAFDLIAYGHDHTLAIASDSGVARVNPGTLMGYRPSDRSEVPATFAVFDADTRRARAFRVGEAGAEAHPSAPGGK